jgi:hypothetical protein
MKRDIWIKIMACLPLGAWDERDGLDLWRTHRGTSPAVEDVSILVDVFHVLGRFTCGACCGSDILDGSPGIYFEIAALKFMNV